MGDSAIIGRILEATGLVTVGISMLLKHMSNQGKIGVWFDYNWGLIIGALIVAVGMLLSNHVPIPVGTQEKASVNLIGCG